MKKVTGDDDDSSSSPTTKPSFNSSFSNSSSYSSTHHMSKLDSMLGAMFMVLAAGSSCLLLLQVHFKASAMGRLYLQLREVDAQFPCGLGQADSGERGWFIRSRGVWLVAYMVFSCVLGMLAMVHSIPQNLLIGGLSNTAYIITTLVFPLLHATAFCHAGAVLYMRLNASLQRIVDDQSACENHQHRGLHQHSSCDPFRILSQDKARHGQAKEEMEEGRGLAKEIFLEELERCRRLQLEINDICGKMSSAFTPALLIITSTFFIYSCYNFYSIWTDLIPKGNIVEISSLLLYSLNILLSVFILSSAVDSLRSQMINNLATYLVILVQFRSP